MATLLQPVEWRAKGGEIPRTKRRATVSLPALINLLGKKFSARVHNLSSGGALIETQAPLRVGCAITLSCGTIEAPATVAWNRHEQFGLKFSAPVTEDRVIQQLYRSNVAADRRRLRELAAN